MIYLLDTNTCIYFLNEASASVISNYNFILVTNNIREFKRVKGIKLENWF